MARRRGQLTARLRELGDEIDAWRAAEISNQKPDGQARLVAGLIVTTWRTAFAEAVLGFERGESAKRIDSTFVTLLDRGFAAIRALSTPRR